MVGVDLAVNDVPIVGEPLAFGVGFIALLLVLFSQILSFYPITLVHEGGHMLTNLLTLRGNLGWTMEDDTSGLTVARQAGMWLATLIVGFSGYAAPSLLGLAAAALIASGNPWAVLIASIILSVLAVGLSRNGLAFVIPALIVLGLTWLLLAGSGTLQAAFAVGIAWLLLFGGLLDAVRLPSDGGDAAALASLTFIPGVLWKLLWIFVALVSLIVGGQLLLRPGYDLG
jgi:hypothetical protein